MYEFEEFPATARGTTIVPLVTLQARGYLSLNKAAHELMGSPNAVKLHYDRNKQVIGLLPVSDTVPNGKRLRLQDNSTTHLVSLRAFCTYYGIDVSVSRRYTAALHNGYLTVDLKQAQGESRQRSAPKKSPGVTTRKTKKEAGQQSIPLSGL